jgi:hypothetical protein
MSDIVLVRLSTGEELLAKQKSETVFEDVCIIIPQGQGNLGIMQFMPYATFKTIEFQKEHIMFIVEPKNELLNEYKKVFGGVMTPPPKKIIT